MYVCVCLYVCIRLYIRLFSAFLLRLLKNQKKNKDVFVCGEVSFVLLLVYVALWWRESASRSNFPLNLAIENLTVVLLFPPAAYIYPGHSISFHLMFCVVCIYVCFLFAVTSDIRHNYEFPNPTFFKC